MGGLRVSDDHIVIVAYISSDDQYKNFSFCLIFIYLYQVSFNLIRISLKLCLEEEKIRRIGELTCTFEWYDLDYPL